MKESKGNNCIFFTLMTVFIVFIAGLKVEAQQTIINVPSSEMLPAGDIILKDSNRFSPFSENGYASLTPSMTMGLGHGVEFSSGIGTMFNEETNIKGDLAIKKVWFLGNSTRFTVGGMVNPYFNQHERPNSFIYGHFSQRIKKTKTSITAGAYLHGVNSCPDTSGVILGIEQVLISNKLRFAMDWLSTPDSFGKMGLGLKYRPVPTVSITSAVIIPNNDDENVAFNVSISKFVSLNDENPIKRRLKNVD